MIVVARGGGSVEDLLPFSDEALVRAVAACRTPVVSAIGHEPDTPLLDLVADVRASTPTDAAKLVVPDVAEELRRVEHGRATGSRSALAGWLAREQRRPRRAARPAGAGRPAQRCSTPGADEVDALRDRARRTLGHRLDRAADDLGHQLRPGPRAVAAGDPASAATPCCRTPTATSSPASADVAPGEPLSVRVADGRVARHRDRHRRPTRPTTEEPDDRRTDGRARPTRRPARSWSRWSAGSRPAAPPSRSRWRSGSAASSSRRSARSWLDGARERLDAAIAATEG